MNSNKAKYISPCSRIIMYGDLMDFSRDVPNGSMEGQDGRADAKGYSFDDYDEEDPFAPKSVGEEAWERWRKNCWED